MKITSGIKVMACSLLLSACSGAEKKQKFLREIYPHGTTKTVLREATQKSREGLDKTYHYFGKDTICIGDDYKIKSENILNKLTNLANNKSIIKRVGIKKSSTSNKYEPIEYKLFKETKGVINSDKVYKSKTGALFIPVEYYGKN